VDDRSTGRDDPSGRGTYDEATGLWDWYEDTPEELTAAGGNYFQWTASQVFAEPVLLYGAFLSELGVDLWAVLPSKTWRWLWTNIQYLMLSDNPLSRRLSPPPASPVEEMPNFE
jgi:hypothetical protein